MDVIHIKQGSLIVLLSFWWFKAIHICLTLSTFYPFSPTVGLLVMVRNKIVKAWVREHLFNLEPVLCTGQKLFILKEDLIFIYRASIKGRIPKNLKNWIYKYLGGWVVHKDVIVHDESKSSYFNNLQFIDLERIVLFQIIS